MHGHCDSTFLIEPNDHPKPQYLGTTTGTRPGSQRITDMFHWNIHWNKCSIYSNFRGFWRISMEVLFRSSGQHRVGHQEGDLLSTLSHLSCSSERVQYRARMESRTRPQARSLGRLGKCLTKRPVANHSWLTYVICGQEFWIANR